MAAPSIPLTARYGVFVCESCRDQPADNCGDACGASWPDELAPVELDYWPSCRCCGRPAHLLEALVSYEAPHGR
jgi:hypothetical protein